MRSKVIFGYPKWPLAAILWKKKEVGYWSEMARNAIESDFRSSKMAAGYHFVNKIKKQSCVVIWNGEKLRFRLIFDNPNAAILWRKFKQQKTCVLIWNDEKFDQKLFSVIQNGRPFCEEIFTKKAEYWSEMARNAVESDFFVIQNSRRRPFCKKKSKNIWWKSLCTQKCTDQLHIWCSHWPDIEGCPYRFWQKSGSKMTTGSHFFAYWSEIARNAIKSDFR